MIQCFPSHISLPVSPLQGFLELLLLFSFFFLSRWRWRIAVGGCLGCCLSYSRPPPPTAAATTGVALAIRLLYTEGLAGFADGCQHQDHEAPTHPHIPLGTLTLRTKVP